MPKNELGMEVPRRGWSFVTPTLLANAFYADVDGPICIAYEPDLIKHQDLMEEAAFTEAIMLRRELEAGEIWLLPYPPGVERMSTDSITNNKIPDIPMKLDQVVFVCDACWEGGEELNLGGVPGKEPTCVCVFCQKRFPRSEVHAVRAIWLKKNWRRK